MPKPVTEKLCQVSINGKGSYTYSYKGFKLSVGDTVVVPVRSSNQTGKVEKLGSDYKGEVKQVICKLLDTASHKDGEMRKDYTTEIKSLADQIAELEASEEARPRSSLSTVRVAAAIQAAPTATVMVS